MRPGEILFGEGAIRLNAGRPTARGATLPDRKSPARSSNAMTSMLAAWMNL